MINVASCQFVQNNFLPYSIAVLVSYLKKFEYVENNFFFMKTFVFKEKLDDYIKACEDIDIFMCSCYIWNWEITLHAAKLVKEKNPNCLIIFGGPQIPLNDPGFFENREYIDIIVHGEGELTLENIFRNYYEKLSIEGIPGTQTKIKKYPPRERITDLETIPSPFLTGTLWELIDDDPDLEWTYIWETSRGCPFQCTFCDWGSATATKMRQFGQDRLIKEINWMEDKEVKTLYIADSNFGIFTARDQLIANTLGDTDIKIMVNWAKVRLERVLSVARAIKDNLLFGMEIAIQTLSSDSLKAIKRSNIKFKSVNELTDILISEGHRAYVELILGLPGETLTGWMDTLNKLISDQNIKIEKNSQIVIRVYLASVLPNAEMANPAYVKKHELKTIEVPVHYKYDDRETGRGINDSKIPPEIEKYICGCTAYNIEDYKQMILYTWMIRLFHLHGITFEYAWYIYKHYDITLDQFYREFYLYLENDNRLNIEYTTHKHRIDYIIEHKRQYISDDMKELQPSTTPDQINGGGLGSLLCVNFNIVRFKPFTRFEWMKILIDVNKHMKNKFGASVSVPTIMAMALNINKNLNT